MERSQQPRNPAEQGHPALDLPSLRRTSDRGLSAMGSRVRLRSWEAFSSREIPRSEGTLPSIGPPVSRLGTRKSQNDNCWLWAIRWVCAASPTRPSGLGFPRCTVPWLAQGKTPAQLAGGFRWRWRLRLPTIATHERNPPHYGKGPVRNGAPVAAGGLGQPDAAWPAWMRDADHADHAGQHHRIGRAAEPIH